MREVALLQLGLVQIKRFGETSQRTHDEVQAVDKPQFQAAAPDSHVHQLGPVIDGLWCHSVVQEVVDDEDSVVPAHVMCDGSHTLVALQLQHLAESLQRIANVDVIVDLLDVVHTAQRLVILWRQRHHVRPHRQVHSVEAIQVIAGNLSAH